MATRATVSVSLPQKSQRNIRFSFLPVDFLRANAAFVQGFSCAVHRGLVNRDDEVAIGRERLWRGQQPHRYAGVLQYLLGLQRLVRRAEGHDQLHQMKVTDFMGLRKER